MAEYDNLPELPADDPRTRLNDTFSKTPGLEDVRMRINRAGEWAITGEVVSQELRDNALALLRDGSDMSRGRTWNFLEVQPSADVAETTATA